MPEQSQTILPTEPLSILRRPQVEARTGLPRSTIYDLVKNGSFPKPINLGPRSVGWIQAEIDSWIAGRMQQSRHPVAKEA